MKTCLRILFAISFVCAGALSCYAEQIEEDWQPYVTYKPDPVVPAVAIRKGWGGTGVYQLTIDPRTGGVDEVKVLRRVGYPVLDAEMVMTFFKWRFKPNTLKRVRIAYSIGILGRSRDYHTGRY